MRPSDFATLELDGLLAVVARHAASVAGATGCRELRPQITAHAVREELGRVSDAREAAENAAPPIGAFPDIRPLLPEACTPGFILESERCLEVLELLSMVRPLQGWLRQHGNGKPRLLRSADLLDDLPDLRDLLEHSLDPDGGLRDNASPELRAIRRKLRSLRSQIESRLGKLMQNSGQGNVFANDYVTVRNGRFVVPVRASAVATVPGIVQDRSASGETLFLEPLSSVDDNNQLLLAAREELEEENRILGQLTLQIGAQEESLGANILLLIDLDTLFARVAFAQKYDAICPVITKREIHLPSARHPLLVMTNRDVTAIEIQLDAETELLVITGPNTGGKSVALKTLGLATLMAQCGIPILAASPARLPVFDQVFTDIGDRQNVADDLSTFSGHVKNLAEILSAATAASLILLDEPGAGTDPDDGAALARILLDELMARKTRTLATTHFQSLKVAALAHPQARVAAVDFDPDTFAPKYRLLYDSVGPSLGLPMARRLGLPHTLIDRAEAEKTESSADLGAALANLEQQRLKLEEEASTLAQERIQLGSLRGEEMRLVAELREKKRRNWVDELRVARHFSEELRREGKRLLDEAKQQPTAAGQPLLDLAREQKRAIAKKSDRHESANPGQRSAAPVKIGDQVRVAENDLVGELVAIEGSRARITRGKIRFDVALNQLEKITGPRDTAKNASRGAFHVQRAASQTESSAEHSMLELHLIGQRVQPALRELERFLDQLLLESRESARIIHGHGTGALRRAVHEHLAQSPHVESYAEAPPAQGGTGATIVRLRQ